jgi:hypothetical protein
MTVDAPSMDIAAETMRITVGKDPLTLVQWKDDIFIADEEATTVHIKVYIKWEGNEDAQGPYGTVYPSDFSIPPEDIAIITAVPANDRIGFQGFQDENGEYLNGRNEFEYAFRAKADTVIYAVFSDTRAPSSNYVFDANTFTISSNNVVSLNTTDTLVDDPYKIPTSQAVFNECEKKIETITLNGREVDINNKKAEIDLTQDYLYEDEDIDFAEIL